MLKLLKRTLGISSIKTLQELIFKMENKPYKKLEVYEPTHAFDSEDEWIGIFDGDLVAINVLMDLKMPIMQETFEEVGGWPEDGEKIVTYYQLKYR